MPSANEGSVRRRAVCEWKTQEDAFRHFARFSGPTQSQRHIKPLHWYVACRLVLEGGFRPEEIKPRPPFVLEKKRRRYLLQFDRSIATGQEATVLGGLKTKDVDVVVTKKGIGPVLAVSCKGMTGALRNLVNRMEETIGECTNLHITYPALVLGYLFVIRAHHAIKAGSAVGSPRPGIPESAIALNDIVISSGGVPVEQIQRFHAALCELSGRSGIRDEPSRYESVALSLVNPQGANQGIVRGDFPPPDSPLRVETFFEKLYIRYDERFVVSAPRLSWITRRLEWSPQSPAFGCVPSPSLGYDLRLDE